MIELAKHIEVLLLENDCVIVPGLGGFIAHSEGALPESLQRHGRVRAQRRHYYAAYEKGQYYGYYGNQQACCLLQAPTSKLFGV